MTARPELWQDAAQRLRPFLARRVPTDDVDDVLQDVFLRIQRGLGALRDEERFTSWLFQVARSAIAEHGRTRARHGVEPAGRARGEIADDLAPDVPEVREPDDRDASRTLATCVSLFVARLHSPYREAVTLVELEGLTAREAAEMAGVSISGMKSRVQRGRVQLRQLLEECCEIALDARGKVTDFTPRPRPCPCPLDPEASRR